MTERTASTVAGVVAVAAFCGATAILHARALSTPAVAVPAPSTMYVRSSELAARLYLSFDAIASDLYWIRAIQYYGRERQAGVKPVRYELLEPLVDLTISLDPHFNRAHRFGAILLALDPPNGPGRPDRAITILEKGLRANPGRWQYAHDIGFVHYFHTGRFDEAARWFRRAATMPDAPRWIGPLAALTLAKGGERQGARQLLVELAATNEGYIRQSAERGLAQLQALDDIDRLESQVTEFRERADRYPRSLSELRHGNATAPIADPSHQPYAYDAEQGTVDLASDSPLRPLPRTLHRQ